MDARKRTVLIVEDDPWTRYALARLFSAYNVPVVAASTVAEAMALPESRPTCIILDLDLPDGRGEAILLAVRDRKLPFRVVVCSAAADRKRLEGVSRLAPDALLQKPVDFDRLAQECRV